MAKPEHGMGWLPDRPDIRDYRYATLAASRLGPKAITALPSRVDLTNLCSPVQDQGSLGACTAFAVVGAVEFLHLKNGYPLKNFSQLFVYYNERKLEGSIRWDSGAYLRDGMKTLANDGVCNLSSWKYRTWLYRWRPSRYAYSSALNHQILTYWRLDTVDEMRTCLADGYPFVFGFTVYNSFFSPVVEQTGAVPMPQPGEREEGGHAVMAVGYDDDQKRFLVRNSWGPGWGQAGYFTIPYQYLANRGLSDDFWTVRVSEDYR